MGWNSWNCFSCDIDEKIIKETADAMADKGYLSAGYNYLTIDDGWMDGVRGEDGRLRANPYKFPKGIAELASYVHSKGLKFGIYSDAGTLTCAGLPASYGNERVDANTFAEWGVDFVKYDFCFAPPGSNDTVLYRRMGQALRETGRPIVYSGCWGTSEAMKWMRSAGAHMWRLTGDIADSWESIEKVGFGAVGTEMYAGPGGWNDPDMMLVGLKGRGYVGKIGGGCTMDEYRTHFSLWCMLAAPLFMGHDVREDDKEVEEILLNGEAIAVNQDCLGVQAFRPSGWADVLIKPLADGTVAAAMFNRTPNRYFYPVAWDAIGWEMTDSVVVRDLWAHEDIGAFTGSVTLPVEPHCCALLRLRRE
jgi:alpha-galactosidase